MTRPGTILVCGTGAFAARIVFDIAAWATEPVAVTISGRNRDRLDWLRTAANARAALYGGKARFEALEADLHADGEASRMMDEVRPSVVVQAASLQTSSVIADSGNAWTRLIGEGGLSVTAATQAYLSVLVARAVPEGAQFINCCLPDVVNPFFPALGLPIAAGTGNISILSAAMAGARGRAEGDGIKLLAHYQNLAAWRQPASERTSRPPRVWIDDVEIDDVFSAFSTLKLTREPAIEISGAAGVPMIIAMATGRTWAGHAPGALGLPGGYPVRWTGSELELDLPKDLTKEQAVGWNAGYEAAKGLSIENGRAVFNGRLAELLAEYGSDLADGYDVSDVVSVHHRTQSLRDRLEKIPA